MSTGETRDDSIGLRLGGLALCVLSAFALLYAGYWVPLSHFGIVGGPADTASVVSSFNRTWLGAVVILSAVYGGGLALIRASTRVTAQPADAASRLFPLLLGALILAVAGMWLAFSAMVFGDAAMAVIAVPLGWSLAAGLFVSIALWRNFPRSWGFLLLTAALVLVASTLFVISTVVDGKGSEIIERVRGGVTSNVAATHTLGFIATVAARMPLVSSGMIVVGLPLLVLPRRRRRGPAVLWGIVGGFLLLFVSMAVPSAMQVVVALSPAALPAVEAAFTSVSPQPPPPPPPPPPGGGSTGSDASFPAPPPPAGTARPPASGATPVRVPDVKPPRKTKDVAPIYPARARDAGTSGVVILEITIGIDGKVVEAKILRTIALLDQAAIDAVRQWEYEPTLVKGQPVAVVMSVTVPFKL